MMDRVPALPLDAFRVLVGVLSAVYFVRSYREVADFGAPNGLLDQQLSARALPFVRLSLLPARTPAHVLRILYALGVAASAMLALGVAPAPAALFLYALAVSAYRRGFFVIGVDDAVVHLVLFWMVVLPIGHTLTIVDPSWDRWPSVTVSGLGVRCMLLNFALLYATAGLWKLTSPLWRSGAALRVVMKMPVSYGLGPRLATWPIAWLRAASYFVLLVEPLGAFVFVLSPGSWPVSIFLVMVIGMHIGISLTVRVALANIGLIAALVAFGVVAGLVPQVSVATQPASAADWMAVGVVGCLAAQVVVDAAFAALGSSSGPATHTGAPYNPFYAPLWAVGLAQSYRLLDWVDERNYEIEYAVIERASDGQAQPVDPRQMFPRTMRHILIQSYLIGDIWTKLDPGVLATLRSSILRRYADRYARTQVHKAVTVEVRARICRVVEADEQPQQADVFLMRFGMREGVLLAFDGQV